jgi:hypothetical protein
MKKLFPGILLYFFVSALMAAQSVVPDSVYQKVDSAFSSLSISDLRAVLASESSAPWYPRLETYVLKKARLLVVQNDLELAKEASLALIDENLDNRDAVDLYQSLSAAIELRDTNAERRADLARVNEYKQKIAEEKIKQDAQKSYSVVTNAETGKKVYLDQDFNTHYRTYTWDLMIGLSNVGFLSDPGASRTRYGLSASGSVFFHGEAVSAGIDAIGDIMILNISGEKGIDWSGAAVLAGSANAISKYLELRLGYAKFGYMYGNELVDPYDFVTPVAGIGIRDASLGKGAHLKMSLDYYPGHLSTDDITLALGGNVLVSFTVAEMQDFSVHFQAGIRDTALLRDTGLMNDAKFHLAIGVGDYD